jgi:beta-glucosidase-like glycosyl hydrolase
MDNELGRKIYQLIVARLDGDRIAEPSYRDEISELVGKGIGGFIIFGGRADEVRGFVRALQARADLPLFIASDVERGVGQQIEGMTLFPPQMALTSVSDNDLSLLEAMTKAVAEECLYTGINMPLIPVMDINTEPENPIICTRAFSDDPDTVSRLGLSVVKGLESRGLLSCVKHFPGHGGTVSDSHIELPVIRKSSDELGATELVPFSEAVNAGVSCVMVGHLSVPRIDDLPASLSPEMIRGILRGDLGFSGLVLTDALNMHALRGSGDAEVRCLYAGADILLHPEDPDSSAASVITAVESGVLDETVIEEAFGRVTELKRRLVTEPGLKPDYGLHDRVAQEISDRSIAVVKAAPGVLPLVDTARASLRLFGDPDDKYVAYLRDVFPSGESGDTVVVALFTEVAAWRGSSGLKNEDIDEAKRVIRSYDKSIVVSFGSPYVLGRFPEASALIAAFDSSERAQRSVCDCLRGLKTFQGNMPVDISILPR